MIILLKPMIIMQQGEILAQFPIFEKVKFTHESGKTKETYYDIGGNIAAEKLGTNSPLIYHYNSINQLTSVVSPAGLTTSYTYDGFGNIASKTNPDEGTYKYKYDTNSNLRFLFHTTASPLELTFNTYDPLNRLVSTGVKSTTATEFNNLNPDILNSFESDTSKLVVAICMINTLLPEYFQLQVTAVL